MPTKLTHYLLAALLCVAFTADLHAQSSAFTYQGYLTQNGAPANGTYGRFPKSKWSHLPSLTPQKSSSVRRRF
jgi:hypothetical protein